MLIYPFKNAAESSAVSKPSATSGATGVGGSVADYTFTSPISLVGKQHDRKNLSVLIDIPIKDGDSGASCILDFCVTGSFTKSGSTFPIIGISGSSLILSTPSNVSVAAGTFYSYFRPLTMTLDQGAYTAGGGTTRWLSSIPYVRLGARARRINETGVTPVYYDAWLAAG